MSPPDCRFCKDTGIQVVDGKQCYCFCAAGHKKYRLEQPRFLQFDHEQEAIAREEETLP